MEYLLLYPDSHEHLGLFEDLKEFDNVKMSIVGLKRVDNSILQKIRKLHISWTINKHVSLPFKTIWYTKPILNLDDSKEYCIIVIDGAMKGLSPKQLNQRFSKPNVRGVLVLINSMDASSVAILESKDKFKETHWDGVYTFDQDDVTKYHYQYLGTCYYSKHDLKQIEKQYPSEKKSTVYYTGGLKGEREQTILSVFKKLHDNGISTNFNLAVSAERNLKPKPYSDEINYYGGGWFPYEKVLAGVGSSEVILDIHQKGQSGPSLRYFEAVCYNKKLLTNNPSIANLPYYDARYMKIFDSVEDIDVEWLQDVTKVDYQYRGDFSPKYLLETVLK